MATLFAIGADLEALAALLDDLDGGELSPETAQALEAWWAEVQTDEEAKIDDYCALVRSLKLRAAARREEMERLQKLVAADEGLQKRLQERLRQYLERTGQKRIDTARYRVSLCANGGKLPVETPPDARALDPEFRRVREEIDVDKVREALEAGRTIFGCQLLPRGAHVRIA